MLQPHYHNLLAAAAAAAVAAAAVAVAVAAAGVAACTPWSHPVLVFTTVCPEPLAPAYGVRTIEE